MKLILEEYGPDKSYRVCADNGVFVGDFLKGDDGYYAFWPGPRLGYWDETFLVALFRKLRNLNRLWDITVRVYELGEKHDNHATAGSDPVQAPDAEVSTGLQEVPVRSTGSAGRSNAARLEGSERLGTSTEEAGRILSEPDRTGKKTCRFDHRFGGWKRTA